MSTWRENILKQLTGVRDEKVLMQSLGSYVRGLGFDYLSCALRIVYPVSDQKVALLDNYPVAWQKQYAQNNYLAIDPVVQRGLEFSLSFAWDAEEALACAKKAAEINFWEEAISAGMKFGWSQPYHELSGAIGIVTLTRSNKPFLESEREALMSKLADFTLVTHFLASRCLAKRVFPSIRDLSDREIEVLRWTSEGKTASEIADIIGISERTVNFHLNNAMLKLQVVNKTAAVMRASCLGLLTELRNTPRNGDRK